MTGSGYLWSLARNAHGRPTLQHAVTSSTSTHSACGWPITGWSRAYLDYPVPTIACKRCAKATGVSLAMSRSRLALVS